MNHITVKVIVTLLLLLDIVLLGAVYGFFPEARQEASLSATEPAPAVTEPTEAKEPTQTLPAATAEAAQATEATQPETRFTLSFAGDCTLGAGPGSYYAQLGFVKTIGDDLGYPFRNVASYFAADDFTLVNLEGVLADKATPAKKSHTFLGPAAFAGILSQGGVDAVSLANDHSMDYGQAGYDATVAALKGQGVSYIGDRQTVLITTPSGLVIGLYAMTLPDLSQRSMTEGIQALKDQGAELIIVAAHWGTDKAYRPDADQEHLAHAAIDAGAHIVFGTQPHVLQPVETYGGGVIFYSLGNFSYGGHGDPDDYDTAILQQEVIRGSDGSISLGQLTVIPASISSETRLNNFQPTPYEPGSPEYDRVLEKLDIASE